MLGLLALLLLLGVGFSSKDKFRPRSLHHEDDKECRPTDIYELGANGKVDPEKFKPGSLEGCHTLFLSDTPLYGKFRFAHKATDVDFHSHDFQCPPRLQMRVS